MTQTEPCRNYKALSAYCRTALLKYSSVTLLKPEVSLDYHTAVNKAKTTFTIEGIRNEHIPCSPTVLHILPPADELPPSPAETEKANI